MSADWVSSGDRQHELRPGAAGPRAGPRTAHLSLAPRRKGRRRRNGAALPVVLAISSMMLVTAAAWLETSTANIRSAVNTHDYLQAFHAADGALALCMRALRVGIAPTLPAVEREPARWREAGIFDGPLAFAPRAQWPGSARSPQCLIEAWRLADRPALQVYLLTARGFGANRSTQVWLQLEAVLDNGAIREAHWRRVVARPT
jgi:hypothetical protein